MDVTQLYDEIYSLCMMRVLADFAEGRATELLVLQHKCQEMLKLYNYLKQTLTEEERLCSGCLDREDETLSDAIRTAYHSVLFADTISDEDLYFWRMPQCGLLEWSENVNPYKDLQAVSEAFVKKQDIRFADFELVFTKVRDLLKKHISDEYLLEEYYEIWKPLETKYLKYTKQSLEQH